MSRDQRLLPYKVRLDIAYQRRDHNSISRIQNNISREYGLDISSGTVNKIHSKYLRTGDVVDSQRNGRPKLLTERDERKIVRMVLRDRTLSTRTIARMLLEESIEVSHMTIERVLKNAGFHSRNVKKGKSISNKNIRERKEFAIEHRWWNLNNWSLIIFSDESDLFPIKSGKLRQWVKNDEIIPSNFLQVELADIHTIKVWGCVSYDGVGNLVRYTDTMTGVKYKSILKNNLLQSFPELEGGIYNREGYIFQNDNARVHRVPIVEQWKEKHAIRTIVWPSQSPDLNIVENLWSYVQDQLYKIRGTLRDADDVWRAAQRIWYAIPLEMVKNLYRSLPRRMISVIRRRGERINY